MDKRKPVIKKDAKILEGSYHKYKDWHMDPSGYLLIRVNREQETIELGHCEADNEIDVLISGKTPQEIYFKAAEIDMVSRPEHWAYMGKELEKAYLALKHGLDYVQDDELDLQQK